MGYTANTILLQLLQKYTVVNIIESFSKIKEDTKDHVFVFKIFKDEFFLSKERYFSASIFSKTILCGSEDVVAISKRSDSFKNDFFESLRKNGEYWNRTVIRQVVLVTFFIYYPDFCTLHAPRKHRRRKTNVKYMRPDMCNKVNNIFYRLFLKTNYVSGRTVFQTSKCG